MTYRPPTETVLGGCAAHTEPHTGLGIPTMGREHGPTFTRPYRFARRYFDDAGEVLCDRCVVEGIKEGSIDLANPADLSYAERDVKEALEHWAEIALDTFGRGIEAADRSGRLPASPPFSSALLHETISNRRSLTSRPATRGSARALPWRTIRQGACHHSRRTSVTQLLDHHNEEAFAGGAHTLGSSRGRAPCLSGKAAREARRIDS